MNPLRAKVSTSSSSPLSSLALRAPSILRSSLRVYPAVLSSSQTYPASTVATVNRYQKLQTLQTRQFHTTPPIMVKAGDAIPNVDLTEGSPGDKVNLSKELASGKGLIIGVPAAFSPGCSETHVPGYLSSDKTKNAGKVFVVAVNDAFVMKAWGKQLDPDGKFRYVADADGSFAKSLDTLFDATGMMGNHRSARFALVTEDGKITKAHVEPDNIGIKESAVENVLG